METETKAKAKAKAFWDRDLEDIESDFLPDGVKITDLPVQNSVDGMPIDDDSYSPQQRGELSPLIKDR